MRAKSQADLHDKLRARRAQYQSAFGLPGTPGFDAVKDLATFCRAFECVDMPADRDRMLIYFGRREAFFRIYSHLNLQPDELAVLYRAVVIPQQGDDE